GEHHDAGGADRSVGGGRERPGDGELDGTGVERGLGGHVVHGGGVAGRAGGGGGRLGRGGGGDGPGGRGPRHVHGGGRRRGGVGGRVVGLERGDAERGRWRRDVRAAGEQPPGVGDVELGDLRGQRDVREPGGGGGRGLEQRRDRAVDERLGRQHLHRGHLAG